MDRHLRAKGAFLCLVILSAMALVLNFSDAKSQDTLYVTKIDLAKEIFRDPIERVVFVTKDLKVFIFNSSEAGRISGSIAKIREYLEEKEVEIEDVAIIIHNHFSPQRFTPRNNKTYYYFKNRGFEGFFSIYYPANKKTRTKKK